MIENWDYTWAMWAKSSVGLNCAGKFGNRVDFCLDAYLCILFYLEGITYEKQLEFHKSPFHQLPDSKQPDYEAEKFDSYTQHFY